MHYCFVILVPDSSPAEGLAVPLLALFGFAFVKGTLVTLGNLMAQTDPEYLLAQFVIFVLPTIVCALYARSKRGVCLAQGKANVPVLEVAQCGVMASGAILLGLVVASMFLPGFKNPETNPLNNFISLVLSPLVCAGLVAPSALVSSVAICLAQYLTAPTQKTEGMEPPRSGAARKASDEAYHIEVPADQREYSIENETTSSEGGEMIGANAMDGVVVRSRNGHACLIDCDTYNMIRSHEA